jgi:hypothetical protein
MTDAEAGRPIFRLTYHSHSRIAADRRKAELGALFSAARSKNRRLDVTGALLISDDFFVQTLEGAETVVRRLYARISKDTRHERVSLIDTRTVEDRVFARWAMARVSADDEPDIPLLMNVDKGGISPAAPRATTPEQDVVLDFMRDALRGDVHTV